MRTYDALVCGTIFTDVIFASIPRMPMPGEEVYSGAFEFTCGGSAYITSVAMSRLGMDVCVLSPLGNDDLSELTEWRLKREGISTDRIYRLDRPLRNVTAAFNHGGDRAFLTYEDKLDFPRYQDHLMQMVRQLASRFILVNPKPEYVPLIEAARSQGMRVVFDLGWDDSWLTDPRLKDILRLGHLYTPNLKEALAITGTETAEQALEALGELLDTVVIKLGPEGAVYSDGGTPKRVKGYPVDHPIDTTGAGDNFLAGLLTGLSRGWPLEEAVRLGNYCGSCSVRGLGGTAASPTWNEVVSVEEFKPKN